MSRRPAAITQADVARAIRAAKQAGAAEVEVRIGEAHHHPHDAVHSRETALAKRGDRPLMSTCPARARRTCTGRQPATARPSGMCASARGRASGSGPNSGPPEFDAEYRAAVTGKPRTAEGRAGGRHAGLAVRPLPRNDAWAALSAATRRQRENIFLHVLESAGQQPLAQDHHATIVAGRERRACDAGAGPQFPRRHARAVPVGAQGEAGQGRSDSGRQEPAAQEGRRLHAVDRGGRAAYERRWPIGTRQRVWLDVLLYTGLRRGDAVRFGRQHVRDGVGHDQDREERRHVAVTLPILPVLAETLAAGPCGDLTYIAGENGQAAHEGDPSATCSARHARRLACRDRRMASARSRRHAAANNGATVAQLEAIFGWTGGTMASLYTRAADRERLAIEAMHKLANAERTSIPAPSIRCGRQGEKPNETNG